MTTQHQVIQLASMLLVFMLQCREVDENCEINKLDANSYKIQHLLAVLRMPRSLQHAAHLDEPSFAILTFSKLSLSLLWQSYCSLSSQQTGARSII